MAIAVVEGSDSEVERIFIGLYTHGIRNIDVGQRTALSREVFVITPSLTKNELGEVLNGIHCKVKRFEEGGLEMPED